MTVEERKEHDKWTKQNPYRDTKISRKHREKLTGWTTGDYEFKRNEK